MLTVHYKKLPKYNPGDPSEADRYDCSECDLDVFNLEIHAQLFHDTEQYEVDEEEQARPIDPPFHPCNVYGCTFPPNHDGRHSWQPGAKEQYEGQVETQSPASGVEVLARDQAHPEVYPLGGEASASRAEILRRHRRNGDGRAQ